MATSTVADAKSEGTTAKPRPPRPIARLLRYVLPYWWQFLVSVALMAMVGLLDAGRLLLIGPIFDRVLNPGSQEKTIPLFKLPGSERFLNLQQLVPSHFHNPWTVVAFALVAATVLKGIFDYAGTYLVNYAGFGMITDLRDNLYNAILRSSAAFFTKHSTGTLLSTMVNDIEKVQYAMSSVLAEFLQQFFTFLFTAAVVVRLGGKLAWVLLLFVPAILYSSRKIGRQVRGTTRGGQDKLADIQNILHETITGNRIVKAFGMENWEVDRFRAAARRLFRANLRLVAAFAISSPLMDILGSIAIALLLLLGRDQIISTGYSRPGYSFDLYYCGLQALRPGAQVRAVQQQFPAGGGSLVGNFPFHGYGRRSAREAGSEADGEICAGRSGLPTCLSPIPVKTPRIRRRCCMVSIWR